MWAIDDTFCSMHLFWKHCVLEFGLEQLIFPFLKMKHTVHIYIYKFLFLREYKKGKNAVCISTAVIGETEEMGVGAGWL